MHTSIGRFRGIAHHPARPDGRKAAKLDMTLSTRLAIAMIALVAIAVAAVGWLSYRSVEQALLPRVLERIETHARLVANELESHVRTGRGDIATFQGLAAISGLM